MVDVINPLVMDLGGVSELVDALNVVDGFLIGLFLVKKSGTCVVGELAEEMLGFFGGAGCVVVRVGV